MKIESEIKYTITNRYTFTRIASLDEIAAYTVENRGVETHTDTYFDTEDFELLKGEVAFRLRTRDRKSMLTFKARGEPDSDIFRRIEVESETEATAKDISQDDLPDLPPVRALHDRMGMVTLSPSLTVTNERRILLLNSGDVLCFELVLDDVTFCGPRGRAGELELEVESLTGMDDDLRHVGAWLAERFDLQPAGPSKYMRGIELVGGIS
ncbi:CYTH domain-containing protein [Candidatus Latescibacterota bacterium]